MTVAVLIQIIGGIGVGGVLVALVNWIANRGKVKGEASKYQAESADILISRVMQQNKELIERVSQQDVKIETINTKFTIQLDEIRVLKTDFWELQLWARRAWALMTLSQQGESGPMPESKAHAQTQPTPNSPIDAT